jgi:hypothetical protein
VAKICRKVPHENIHGEASVLKLKKKKLNRNISRREKKRVLKSPHFEEEKNRFSNCRNLWRIWANSKLSSFETHL